MLERPPISGRDLTALETAIAAWAEATADLVGQFLQDAGLRATRSRTAHVPAALLMALGGLLRLRQWQAAGLMPGPEAGLPDAGKELDAIRQQIVDTGAEQVDPRPLSFWFLWTNFTWLCSFSQQAPNRVGADLLVIGDDLVASVDSVAAFLWSNRNLKESQR